MSDVLQRSTLRYEKSVDIGNCPIGCATCNPDTLCVVNPDMSAVVGVDRKYWKLTGDVVSAMTAGEQTAKNAAITTHWTDDLIRYPHKAGAGSVGAESAVAGAGYPETTGRVFVMANNGPTVDFLVNRILTETDTGTTGKLLIGTATCNNRLPTDNPVIIKNVVMIDSPTPGTIDLDGSLFNKFMVLIDDLIWAYIGPGYQRIKYVTEGTNLNGYYYKTYITPGNLVNGLSLTGFTAYNTPAQKLKLKMFG